jgi:fatty aldehyde-generating acyl-ACP reductase
MAKFCFVIHPLSFEDVSRYEPGALGKGRPIIAKILEWMPSYAAAHVTGVRAPDGRETEGWFVAAPLLPSQMLEFPREQVYDRIVRAIEVGIALGARIAGLGAFTGVVGDGGVTIAQRVSIPVTTGNSLTISAGVASLFRGAEEMQIDTRESTAVVVGATGSIGAACVRLIAPRVRELILVARNETRLRKFHAAVASELPCPSSHTTDLASAVRAGDLILTATSSTQEIIQPEDLRPGAVVCEVSLPHDVSRRVALERPDVLVIEGGNMRVPGDPKIMRVREPDQEFDLGLPRGTALACMSETMTLALEDRLESYTLGRGVDVEKVVEIERLAKRNGFVLADLRAFDLAITKEQIEKTRRAAAAKRGNAGARPVRTPRRLSTGDGPGANGAPGRETVGGRAAWGGAPRN